MGKKMSDKNLRANQVMEKLGIGRSTLYELIGRGILPKPYKIGRTSLWSENELDEIIEKQKAERGELFVKTSEINAA
jgi:prophage regulatory protein